MRTFRWYWLGIAGVLFLGFHYVQITFFGPSDATMIHDALTDAVKASKEGRPGGVLANISDSFRLNGASYGGADIADVIRNQKPEVDVDFVQPTVSGDYAKMTTTVRVKIGVLGFSQQVPLQNVTIAFHKETGHDWLLFPTPHWRLDQVTVPNHDLPAEFGGDAR